MNATTLTSTMRAVFCFALLLTGMSARADWYDTPVLQAASQASSLNAPTSINATQLVWGSSLTVNQLAVSGPGTVTVQLADLKWPEALSTLSFLITDLNSTSYTLTGPGSLSFAVGSPANFFAAVFADAGGGAGLYHLDVTFTAVPLPGAALLLLSGMGGVGAFARRRRRAK